MMEALGLQPVALAYRRAIRTDDRVEFEPVSPVPPGLSPAGEHYIRPVINRSEQWLPGLLRLLLRLVDTFCYKGIL